MYRDILTKYQNEKSFLGMFKFPELIRHVTKKIIRYDLLEI